MKKLILSILFISGWIATGSAQSNVIKTNSLGLAFGYFNVTYEKAYNLSSSYLVSAKYQFRLFGVDVNAFGAGIAYRYYFTHSHKDVPTGFYVHPQLAFEFGQGEGIAQSKVNYNALNFGAEIGYQLRFRTGLAIDLGIGPYYTVLGDDYLGIDFDQGSGVLTAISLAIGYSW